MADKRDNDFTKILGWPGYRVFQHEINETAKTLRLWVRRRRGRGPLICSGCDGRVHGVVDVSEREVRDLPWGEYRTTVVVEVFRVRCPTCGVRVERVPQLPSKAPFSKRFEEAVGLACEAASARQVARQFGLAASTVRAIDFAPGLAAIGTAGYAWSEETWRGYVGAALRRPGWRANVGYGRLLDVTNDFRSPLDSGSVWFPLLWSSDGYDYVDRHIARVAAEKQLTANGSFARLEVGAVRDAETFQNRRRGWLFGPFPPNRVVDPGRYGRIVANLEWNPDVQMDLTRERIGGAIRSEVGFGDLELDPWWIRVMPAHVVHREHEAVELRAHPCDRG